MVTSQSSLTASLNVLKDLAGSSSGQCLVALAQFVAGDPILSSVFVTFLQTLKTQVIAQKAQAQAAIAQATVLASLLNSQIQAAEALVGTATGLGGRFPLQTLMRCPFIRDAVNSVQGSAASKVPNPIQQVKYVIKETKYQLRRLQIKIEKLNTSIANFTKTEATIDALIDYYNKLLDFPG